MPAQISVTTDIKALTRALNDVQRKQIPFAVANALTTVAFKSRAAMPERLRSSLDTPKPFTAGVGALYVTKATKASLTAVVGFKDIQARYMQYQIAGGGRRQKGYEKWLQGIGALPAGWVTTPGPAAPIDRFGNIRPRELSQMLASLQRGIGQFKSSGRGRKRAARLYAFFVAGPKSQDPRAARLAPGVWQRIGSGRQSRIVPWLLFTPSANYQEKRFDFNRYVREVVDANFVKDFRQAFDRAMATAR